jgi:hypothetical protein
MGTTPAADDDYDDAAELTIVSFVVRLWIEEAASQRRSALWRGHITHVASGEQRHFTRLYDVSAFIAPYLERLGARPFHWPHVRDWFPLQRQRK